MKVESPKREALINDALESGFTVYTPTSYNSTIIVKRNNRGAITRGLEILDNGTGIDLTVSHLSHAKGLRSYADFRAVLGLNR